MGNGGFRLGDLESQVMGGKPSSSLDTDKKINFKEESVRIPSEIIDSILDMITKTRTSILEVILSAFTQLTELGFSKGRGRVEDPQAFITAFSDRIVSDLKLKPPSEEQLKAPVEFINILSKQNAQMPDEVERTDMINTYLGLWSFSIALYLLTYITFAHESTARYPRKTRKSDKKHLGCEDYDESLGIVNRIGRIGYVTSLILNDVKKELEIIAYFFEMKLLHN